MFVWQQRGRRVHIGAVYEPLPVHRCESCGFDTPHEEAGACCVCGTETHAAQD